MFVTRLHCVINYCYRFLQNKFETTFRYISSFSCLPFEHKSIKQKDYERTNFGKLVLSSPVKRFILKLPAGTVPLYCR